MKHNLFSSRHSSPPHPESTTTSHSSSSPNRTRHTFSDQMMEENIVNAAAIITKLEVHGGSTTSSNFPSLFQDGEQQGNQLLGAIHDLKQTMQYLIKQNSSSESLLRAQNLMEIAMKTLEKEFHSILSRNKNILDPESASHIEESNNINKDEEEEHKNHNNSFLKDLKIIAECMIDSGYSKECVNIYKLARKSIVDEGLFNLGFLDKIPTQAQIQKLEWDFVENKIQNYLKGIKLAIKNIFLGERILCDYVFSSSEKMIDSIFVEVAKDRAY